MTIQEYIADYLRRKLHDQRTLLIYDGERRYHELVKSLASDKVKLVDVTESAVSSREDALEYYGEVLPFQPEKRLVVYVPRPKPEHTADKISDPFWPFQFGGGLFPDGPSDDYNELCRACFPDKEAQLETLFNQETFPAFETIDTLGGGQVFARLQTLAGGQSEREIILGVLFPHDPVALTKDRHFLKEWRAFSRAVLGYKKAEADRDKDLSSVQQSLWQYLLFSEFVYDLPDARQNDLPTSLNSVSRGAAAQKSLVLALGETLRDGQRYRERYLEQASRVAEALDLSYLFEDEKDLGRIVTFDFEDRHYIEQIVAGLLANKLDEVGNLLAASRSLWAQTDPERQKHWKLAADVYELLSFPPPRPTVRTLRDVVAEYTKQGYRLDRLHRQIETLRLEIAEPDPGFDDLLNHARTFFREQTETRQRGYQAAVAAEGYPLPAALPATTTIFDQQVAPLLKAGKRVAYLLIDALRYELLRETEEILLRTGQAASVEPYLAALPSFTKLGMAALLPGADRDLTLSRQSNGELEAALGDTVLLIRADREKFLRDRFGDQMLMLDLGKFRDRLPIPETVKLLVLTATDLDSAGENMPDQGLTMVVPLLRKLTQVLQPLKQAKFDKVLITTDHGFVWQSFSPGDKVIEPPGEWPLRKLRVLLGDGAESADTLSFDPAFVGLRTDQPRVSFARQFTTFQRNVTYFHEGLSLQENVVGLLSVTFKNSKRPQKRLDWELTYRGETSGSITTRRPAVDIKVLAEELFVAEPVTVRVDILDTQERAVGQASLDDSAGLLSLTPGEATHRLTLAMDDEFEGSFTVRLSNPVSGAIHASLSLQTNYAS